MRAFYKVVNFLYKAIMYTVSIALGIMIVIAFIEVVRRYVIGKSYIWADDLIRYLIIYVGFVGGAAAYRDNNLASLDLLTQHFPSIKHSVGVGLRIGLWIPYLALPIGFAVMLLFSVEKYIDMFKRLLKGGSVEECS